MEKAQDSKMNKNRFIIFLCILCAAVIGLVGIFHLIAYDRVGDYFCAAAANAMLWPLITVYRRLGKE